MNRTTNILDPEHNSPKLCFVYRIHVMSGKVTSPNAENDAVYESNLRYAVEQFEHAGIVGLIEPINPVTVPNYYMNSFENGNPINLSSIHYLV